MSIGEKIEEIMYDAWLAGIFDMMHDKARSVHEKNTNLDLSEAYEIAYKELLIEKNKQDAKENLE